MQRTGRLWVIVATAAILILCALGGLIAAFSSGAGDGSADDASAFQSPIITPTVTLTPTATATLTPTVAVPTATATATIVPSPTPPFPEVEISYSEDVGANCHFRLEKKGWMKDLQRIPAGQRVMVFGEAYAPIAWDAVGPEASHLAEDAEVSPGNFNMWLVTYDGRVCFIRKALTRPIDK